MTFTGYAYPLPRDSSCSVNWQHEITGCETAASDNLLAGIAGSPEWRGAGSGAHGIAHNVLHAYRTLGVRCLESLYGDFALAISDASTQTVLLAIDRLGVQKLAYAVTKNGVSFSSSAAEVARREQMSGQLRPQAFFDFLLLHMIPSPQTVYENVFKLRAGTAALIQNGKAKVTHYWRPAFVEAGRKESFDDLKSSLHSSLRNAVAASKPDNATGAFLSGGLDSSTVAGVLAQVRGGSARTFSIGFGVDAYDELKYARIASRHFGTQGTEYNVTPDDIVTALPIIAGAYDEPFGNSSAVPTYFCARLAATHGVTHLLAGDGGDELFGGNERYARQRVFEPYLAIPKSLRLGLIEPLFGRGDTEVGFLPLRKLRSYIQQARIELPERLESWNLMYRTDLATMFDQEYLASINPREPLSIMREVYDAAPANSLLNKLLYFDWQYTLADNDLRKVGTMCELAGVRVSYPMLDDGVLDLSLRVPPQLKMKGAELRTFYKRAMIGFLPPQILNKHKHGFGLPFGVWLKSHRRLADLIFTLLTDLKSRRLVRQDFLDQLIDRQRSGEPGYFGSAIWDLAMLEAWLSRHG